MGMETHFYETEVEWIKGRRAFLRAEGLPELTVSTPPEFKGEAGYWTPEHLYVAAAEACLMATFMGIAENSALPVAGYHSSARGRLERVDGIGLCFTAVEMFPEVELEAGADVERAKRIMDKAAKSCLIANSMLAAVEVSPEFRVLERIAA